MAEVPENALVRTLILKVEAHHEMDKLLYYSLSVPEDLRSVNHFSLDTVTGELRLAKLLDRETLAKHVLKVTAYERLDPFQSATVTVSIDVLDVQDNAPQFEHSIYYAEIREDAPIGTTVLSVFARDLDDGINGEIEYALDNEKEEGMWSKLFSINSKSGVLQTAAQLDHETLPSVLHLKIIASDHGKPPMRGSADLEITILDVNDNAPHFDENFECVANLPEDLPLPAVILQPKATDADSGVNGKIHYSIVTASIPIFSIDYESGAITMNTRVDPRQSPLTLLIRAKDAGQQPTALSSTITCTVNILDVNDHSPVFVGITSTSDNTIELVLDEDAPIGQELTRLLAVDEDTGKNGEIHYQIGIPTNGSVENELPFEVDRTTGVLRTKEKLDREQRAEYQFQIIAFDGGTPAKNSSVNVLVHVKDVNDNAPMFKKLLYELELDEDTPRGRELLTLKAVDLDVTDGEKLAYKIERQIPASKNGDGDMFALTNIGGAAQDALLSLARQFSPSDRNFTLLISATDRNGLKGHCNVSIQIKDVNRPPQFVPHPFTVRIPENAPIGSTVLHIHAQDEDHGANAKLNFSMESKEFAIDAHTGLVTVRTQLDREKQPIHTVDVRVQDNGNPSLATATVLEIALEDVNDNAPHFLKEQYQTSIREDMPVGTSFLQLEATDPDEGPNGLVDFFLDQDDMFVRMDHFRLDKTSGMLRVNQPLDREHIAEYILPVIARDRGTPQALSTRSQIKITVEDVNDNAPNFEFPSYDFWIAENSEIGTIVGRIQATDADEGENAKIQYKIIGGPDARFFELDQGMESSDEKKNSICIRARTLFDYESGQNKFNIEMQASSGQLSRSVSVRIHVSDVNDHPPQLADPFVLVVAQFLHDIDNNADGSEGNRISNITIGQVPAFDPDQNATLEFFAEKNPIFDLNAITGVISLKDSQFHGQVDAEYSVCVTDGPNSICSKAQIYLVPISAELLRLNAVSVLLPGVRRDEFLSPTIFNRFRQTMATLWGWTLPENVRIFAVDSNNVDGEEAALLVKFFIAESTGNMIDLNDDSLMDDDHTTFLTFQAVSAWKVEEAISERATNLSTLFGAQIQLFFNEFCAKEPCPYFQICRSTLRYMGEQETVSTESFLFKSVATVPTFSCECPRGFTTNHSMPGECNQRLNLCFDGPCLHAGKCHPLENSYRCECIDGWNGHNCELRSEHVDTCLPGYCMSGSKCDLKRAERKFTCSGCPHRSVDSDERCRLRSLSFGGDSFLIFPRAPSRMEWQLRMSVATILPSATLLYSGNNMQQQSDFFHLFLKGGIPTVEFSLGDSNRTFSLSLPESKENRVNDGEWHTISLEFYEWKLRLSLDNCEAQSAILLGNLGPQCAIELEMNLPEKCVHDLAVPCYRFLDLPHGVMSLGGMNTKSSKKEPIYGAFTGTIKDLYLDGILLDFSEWEQLDRSGPNLWTGSKPFRPDNCVEEQNNVKKLTNNFTTKNLCPMQSRCIDRWLGHNCRCALRVHTPEKNCLTFQIGQEPPALTLAEDSYVVWQLPERVSYPFQLYFEFRTRERQTQLMALEFDVPTQLLLFSLESGQALVHVNGEQYFLPYPQLSDGTWHSVLVQYGTEKGVELTVDALYKKQISLLEHPLVLSVPLALYTGTVPSSSHPAQFLGCVRAVEWSRMRLNVAQQSGTRTGCLAPNQCSSSTNSNNICPANSRCVRDWDRHICKCNLGFVGDNCVDVCSIPGICGNGGICVQNANTDNGGYECICAEGGGTFGQNCQRKILLPAQQCPPGWYGNFTGCRPCECPQTSGFTGECHPISGECHCQDGSFLAQHLNGQHYCRPCDCGYGTEPGWEHQCNPLNGKCRCIGKATGHKCDRCEQIDGINQLLERHTLKCVHVPDYCPTELVDGIQWPTTAIGAITRQACSAPAKMGIATRKCASGAGGRGEWMEVNTHNCTVPALFKMLEEIESITNDLYDQSGAQILYEWANQLANITTAVHNWPLTGRSMQMATSILVKLIQRQINLTSAKQMNANNNISNSTGNENGMRAPYIVQQQPTRQILKFIRHILRSADSILGNPVPITISSAAREMLGIQLFEFGQHLTRNIATAQDLSIFHFIGLNFVFGIYYIHLPNQQSTYHSTTRHHIIANDRFSQQLIQAELLFHGQNIVESEESPGNHTRIAKSIPVFLMSLAATNINGNNVFNNNKMPEIIGIYCPLNLTNTRLRLTITTMQNSSSQVSHNPPLQLWQLLRNDQSKDFAISFERNFSMFNNYYGRPQIVKNYFSNESHLTCELPLQNAHPILLWLKNAEKLLNAQNPILDNRFLSAIVFGTGEGLTKMAWIFIIFVAFLLLIIAFAVIVTRNAKNHFQQNFSNTSCLITIAVIAGNSILLLLVHHYSLRYDPIENCSMRNALCALTNVMQFAWLFITANHFYKYIVQGKFHNGCTTFIWLIGALLPILSGSAEFFMSYIQKDLSCFLSFSGKHIFPMILLPALFCLLTLYLVITSWILTCLKHCNPLPSAMALRRLLLLHFILVTLCAIHTAIALCTLFQIPTNHGPPSSSKLFMLNAFTFVLVAFVLCLWAVCFRRNFLPIGTSAPSSPEYDAKLSESLWMVKQNRPNGCGENRALICYTDSGNATNQQQKTIRDHDVYEGIPNEWNGSSGGNCGETASSNYGLFGSNGGGGATYVHHTLQRSLQFSPHHIMRGTPMVARIADAGTDNSQTNMIHTEQSLYYQQQHSDTCTQLEENGNHHHHNRFAYSTLPNNIVYCASSPFKLRQIQPLHYGSFRMVADVPPPEEYTPMNSIINESPKRTQHDGTPICSPRTRHQTQPVQLVYPSIGSPRAAKFGALDDELNSAYFTFKRRRESSSAAAAVGINNHMKTASPIGGIQNTTTFN